MIKATIIADSISVSEDRLTTFEFEYPRFIHSEIMTHRMLSKNAASSRAIPITKMHDSIRSNPGDPIYWGKNRSGMQAKEELTSSDLTDVLELWEEAKQKCLEISSKMAEKGLHKQIANRITEPFQTMKTVISGTEWNNFFYLRDHQDAQPEFKALAASAKEAMRDSSPKLLINGQWHLPYVSDSMLESLGLDDAIMVSASCCAQVSYRNNDDSVEKARKIFDQLINTSPVHASPVEHQATPMDMPTEDYIGMPNLNSHNGITHVRMDGSFWSGNFRGWVQYRQTLPNHTKW